jgi:UDP-N-acetylglucosamine acyltransferase
MSHHPSAIIDSSARLGSGIEVGPGAVIGPGATVGDGCVIGPHAVIHGFATLGDGCRVHAGAVIGDTPQDLAFLPEVKSYVRIGARCVLREGVTIHRGTKEGTETIVGDDGYLMANSHLAHNVKLGNKVILANGALLGGYVEVGDGAFISGNAVVHQFCRIGRLAMVGGLSGIGKDVPPFCMTRSGSINTVVGLNIVGLRRHGFTPAQRMAARECLGILYERGLNVSQALAVLRERTEDPVAMAWVDFISSAKRGICRFSSRGSDEE